ncbi:thiamine biosynthesis protein ThiS [Deinococcus aerolatus]|uniref:Thiamine biosynthesis protein ThiS n=1 Tax=Deinococcus aerolatus TaxID=522487 RepID=A0ABQ2GD60_9DEIO|nr:sulfur carrier protein ThiS [Deinococcus aerolatus]GGL86556.1 thiamine biosynthesis protein ThiS [Deinococcus aerolatus]
MPLEKVPLKDLQLNGEPHPYRAGLTLLLLLRELNISPERVAVAVNDDFYPGARIPDRPLAPGDTVEIVRITGGG